MQEDVLHNVVYFISGYAGQDDAVHKWRIKIIEPCELVTIAFYYRRYECHFRPGFGSFGGDRAFPLTRY
jgi:hypothetical protein